MENHQKFLRTALFSEKSVISYRLLSRKLKVHVNQAKEMLYDFHATENARKPNCVHATYVVTGFRKPRPSTRGKAGSGGESKDMEMQYSPFDSSFPGTQTTVAGEGEEKSKKKGEELMLRVVELCQEEELDVAKAQFEKVLSVHVYSLEPVPLKDLSTLTGCSADVFEILQKEDPLKMGATYGTVLNPGTKRTGSRAPPASDLKKLTLAVQEKKEEVVPKNEIKPEKKDTKPKELEVGAGEKEKKIGTKISTAPAKKTAPSAAAKPKRGQSNLFASWGNAPKKSAEMASESNSVAQSPKTEDEPDIKMESDNDDEAEDEPSLPVRDNAEDIRKRKEKEDELKKMMDDDGDGDIKMGDDELLTEVAKAESSPEAEEPSETTTDVPSTGGRRRGRRKIMKKVQSRDDEGYLVTKTKATWESFSEDEPEPLPRPKPKAPVKGKKGAAAGQGNIMSFFGKK